MGFVEALPHRRPRSSPLLTLVDEWCFKCSTSVLSAPGVLHAGVQRPRLAERIEVGAPTAFVAEEPNLLEADRASRVRMLRIHGPRCLGARRGHSDPITRRPSRCRSTERAEPSGAGPAPPVHHVARHPVDRAVPATPIVPTTRISGHLSPSNESHPHPDHSARPKSRRSLVESSDSR